jgi:ornithine cyclodeaminase/alanine dehydrogenase-like protein (mu-crystallin family)
MLFVSATEIRRVLSFPLLVDALADAHRRPKIVVHDTMLGSEQALYFIRNAVDDGRFMASKLITSFPANLAGGTLPAVHAVCVLFDGTNGQPLAVLDGTEITYWRTAADSALGARLLARHDAATLLVVGAGGMSRWLVHAHCAVRPSLRRVLVWNRSPQRAAEVAGVLSGEGFAAEAVDDLDGATQIADIITTCTRSRVPLVRGANLKAGTHLDLVGGYARAPRSRRCRSAAGADLRRSPRVGIRGRRRHPRAGRERRDPRSRRAWRSL